MTVSPLPEDHERLASDSQMGAVRAEASGQPELQMYVDRTIDLLRAPDFSERFVAVYTGKEVAALERARDDIQVAANQQARAKVREIAAESLGIEVPAIKKPPQLWHDTLKDIGQTVLEHTEGMTLKDYWFGQFMVVVGESEEHTVKLATAQQVLECKQQTTAEQVEELLRELDERRADPELLEAAALWANSPDSQDDRGPDGQGYNAGLIHFFEYRSVLAKIRRFRDLGEPMSADGFVAFSHRLYNELMNSALSTVNQHVVLEDSDGNRRFYTLCPTGEFIVAFQRTHEALPRMTSMINPVTPGYYEQVVAECLSGDDRGRINKLNPHVRRIV